MKKALAGVATLALALTGCSDSGSTTTGRGTPESALEMALTLPDGTVINTVNYTVTGGPSSVNRPGTVNVTNSSVLRFRVGDLPVGPNYTMALGATTATGTACAGSAGFNIADNQVTTLTMTLTCGSGVTYEVDANGDVSVSVDVVNQAGGTCNVVTGISALPLETAVGSSLELQGYLSSTQSGQTVAWTGEGGTFSAAAAAATSFACVSGGDHVLTFARTLTGCDPSSQTVTVTCTGAVVVPDAGPDASPEPDAGPDAGPEPDAGPDSGPVPDAGPDSGPAPDTCDECIAAAESPCRNYQGTGFDLYANCVQNADPDIAQRCVNAYECSMQAADLCAGDQVRGPISCYCGLDRTIDQCNATPSATTGPNGACIPQWEAAANCPAGDNVCVNDFFVDLTRASGGAYYLIRCATNDCASSCALPRPAN